MRTGRISRLSRPHDDYDEEYPRGGSGTAREASGGQPLPGDGDIGGLSAGQAATAAPAAQHGAQPAPPTPSRIDLAAPVHASIAQRSRHGGPEATLCIRAEGPEGRVIADLDITLAAGVAGQFAQSYRDVAHAVLQRLAAAINTGESL